MIASLETVGTLHTHTHTHTLCLVDREITSFLVSKLNLIKKINRVNFVYMLVIPLRI